MLAAGGCSAMPRPSTTPGEVKLYGMFSMHLGPRFSSAGLGVQFHYNQEPGIHFKVEVKPEYRDAISKGLRDAMALRFPEFPETASIWITNVDAHEVDSSWMAFYQAARMVIEQAYSLAQPVEARSKVQMDP
jgi:translation elongation factor EF-G